MSVRCWCGEFRCAWVSIDDQSSLRQLVARCFARSTTHHGAEDSLTPRIFRCSALYQKGHLCATPDTHRTTCMYHQLMQHEARVPLSGVLPVSFEPAPEPGGTLADSASFECPRFSNLVKTELTGEDLNVVAKFFGLPMAHSEGYPPSWTTIVQLLELQKHSTQFLMVAGSSAVTVAIYKGLYQLMKLWVDAQNGRKLKIKVGDIEVEATQMKQKDVVRLFELLQEKADRTKIRDLLLEGKKVTGPESR